MKRSKPLLPQQLARSQVVVFSHGHGLERSPGPHLHQLLQNSTKSRSTSAPFVTSAARTLHPALMTPPLHSIFPPPALGQGGTVSLLTLRSASLLQPSERCKPGEVKQVPPLPSLPLDQAHKSITISAQAHQVWGRLRLRSPTHTTSLEVEVSPPACLIVLPLFDHRPLIPSRILIPTPIMVSRPCLSSGGASQKLVTLLYRITDSPTVLQQPQLHH